MFRKNLPILGLLILLLLLGAAWALVSPKSKIANNTNTSQANIQVTEPTPNAEIGLPLIIKGQARVFENQFNYRLKDSDGSILAEGTAHAIAPIDSGRFGEFTITANYPTPKGTTGTVEVFDYSAKDGSEIDKVVIPIRFKS